MLTTIAFGALGLGIVAAIVMTVWSRRIEHKSEELAETHKGSAQHPRG